MRASSALLSFLLVLRSVDAYSASCTLQWPGDANRQICLNATCWGKKKALEACDRLITKGPDYGAGGNEEDLAFAYVARGGMYDEDGKYSEADSDYEKAVKVDPKSYYTWANIGISYYTRKAYSKALTYLDQAIKIDGSNPYAYEVRADTYEQLGDSGRATADRATSAKLSSTYHGK